MATTNMVKNTSASIYEENMSLSYVTSGALSLVTVSGAFGNILVIYSILKQKNLLKKNYYYLALHLAACDLFYLLVNILDIFTLFFFPSSRALRLRSMFLCKTLFLSSILFYQAGSYFMILIAILRYRAVVYPLKTAVSRWKVRILAGIGYLCSFICLIPYILVLRSSKTGGCVMKWPYQTLRAIYVAFLSTIQYFVPVIILLVLYCMIYRKLLKRNERITSMNSTSAVVTTEDVGTQRNIQRLKHHRNIRSFINCGAVVVCFAAAGFPVHLCVVLINVADVRLKYNQNIHAWLWAVNVIGTSAVNPFIYGFFDKKLLSASKRCFRNVISIFPCPKRR